MKPEPNVTPCVVADQISESQALPLALQVRDLSLTIDGQSLLRDVTLNVPLRGVTTLIGPSGAGKSSLLRCLNRLHENWQGEVAIDGVNVRQWPGGVDVLRRHAGLIGQKPCVFPTTIAANVMFGLPRLQRKRRAVLEQCLRQAALWDEVKDRLQSPAMSLSLGQQQRLCIARALAVQPKLLMLDEPTASLDPRSKQLIEQTMCELAQTIPVICVTHDLDQAQRLGGQVVFMCDGKVIEAATCASFFNSPQRIESREFLRWSVCDC